MVEKVKVTAAPTAFTIAAGDTAEAIVSIHNLGQTVDQFTLSIGSLDTSWYTLPVSSVALFPTTRITLKLSCIHLRRLK